MATWGWWRMSAGSHRPTDARLGELAAVVGDWLDEHGHPSGPWFRQPSEAAWHRGDGPLPTERVLCGATPLLCPGTRLEGPWLRVAHVLVQGAFGEAAANLPCLTFVEELVVHAFTAVNWRGDLGERARIDLDALGPLAPQLRGLWLLDHTPVGDWRPLTQLTEAQLRLDGVLDHPGLRVLHLHGVGPRSALHCPALKRLDIEGLDPEAFAGLLERSALHTIEEVELECTLLPVLWTHRLPALRRVRVWGPIDAGAPRGIDLIQLAPFGRPDARITGDWVYDRAIVGLDAPSPGIPMV